MDDIEDLGPSLDGLDIEESSSRNRESVTIRRTNKRQVADKKSGGNTIEETKQVPEAALPGVGTVWLKTWGCSHNVSDSEYMAGQLAVHGYEVTEDESRREEADLWLLNSCTVKDPSQAAFVNLLRAGRDRVDKKTGLSKPVPLVLAGCVPQAERNLKSLDGLGDGVSLVGVAQLERVVEIRRNPLVEIVPLSTGCLGACTYCKTVHARGKLGSYALEDIMQRIEDAIKEGVTEIWLSSEDTGAYGIDLGKSLTDLLRAMTKPGGVLDGTEVMVRLGMTNPPYMLNQLEAIADAMRHPNVFAFLHIPVQSGANPVLKAMNREYTREEFELVADGLNSYLEDVGGFTLATDVICGFPGETDEDFEDTMSLFHKYQFPVLNISQFYARPGTPAAKMKRVPNGVAKSRSKALTLAFEKLNPHEYLVGQEVKVWINTETSPAGPGRMEQTVGHTKNYTKVLLPLDPNLVGCVAKVIVESSSRWHVVGQVISYEKVHDPAKLKLALRNKAGTMAKNVKEECGGGSCGSEECCGGGSCGTILKDEDYGEEDTCCGDGSCGSSEACSLAPSELKDEQGRVIQYDEDGKAFVEDTVGRNHKRLIGWFIVVFTVLAAVALIYDDVSKRSEEAQEL